MHCREESLLTASGIEVYTLLEMAKERGKRIELNRPQNNSLKHDVDLDNERFSAKQ
jgi:hypothetical protein